MKKCLNLFTVSAMALGLMSMPVHATETESEILLNGVAYEGTLNEAIAESTEEDVISISGRVEMVGVEGTSKVTDMKGVLIEGASDDAELVFVNYPDSNVTGTGSFDNLNLKNLSVTDETFYTGENGENAWEFTYLEFGGDNSFENVTFTDGIKLEGESSYFEGCTFMGHANDSSTYGNGKMYGVWVSGETAEFYDCSFVGTRGFKTHEQYGNDVKNILIDGCKFVNLTEKPGLALGTLNADTTIKVTNSVFVNCQPGDQDMYAYESDTDVTTFGFDFDDSNVVYNGELTEVEAKDATCTEDGNIEHLYGAGGEVYLDYNYNLLTKEDITVKATGHSYVDGECEHCHDVISMNFPEDNDATLSADDKDFVLNEAGKVVEDVLNGEELDSIDEETALALKDAVENGAKIDAEIVVNVIENKDVEDKDATLLVDALNKEDADLVMLLDIKINLLADGQPIGTLNSLGDEISFVIELPEGIDEVGKTFFMIRVHGDKTDVLPLTKLEDGKYVFSTDKFSTYALAYKEVKEDKPVEDTPADDVTPEKDTTSKQEGVNTGDVTNVGSLLTMLGGSLVVLLKKRK